MFITQFVKQSLRRFRGSQFWRSVTILAGSTAIGKLLSIITTPIITRLYKPEDFGLVAVYTSILGFIAAVVCLSYQYAILPPDDDVDAANVLALCLLIAVGISVITVPIIYFWRISIAEKLDENRFSSYLWFLPLSMLFKGFYQPFNFWATRREAFNHLAKTNLSRSISSIVVKVGLGLLNFRPLGLFIGILMSDSIGIGVLFRLAWLGDQKIFKSVTLPGIKRAFRRYIRFPLLTTPTALINAAGTNLPIMLLTIFYGTQVTGWFGLAYQLIFIPTTLVGTAIGQVYLGEITSLIHEKPRKIYRLFIKTVKRLVLISLLPTFMLLIGGSSFVPLVLGNEWRETGFYLQLLSFSFMANFIATPVSRVFSVLERQDLALLWNITRLVIVTIGFYGARIMGVSARMAILFFSISMMLVDVYRVFLVSKVILSVS